MLAFHAAREAVESLRREARRVVPMALGIAWGVASVFLLGAVARGFEREQRRTLDALGDSFLLLRFNKQIDSRGDTRVTQTTRIDYEDIERVRVFAPAVAEISPKAFIWFCRAVSGGEQTRVQAIGVDASYQRICSVPIEPGGRFLDALDIERANDVMVIGPRVKAELFPDEPAVGKKVKLIVRGFRGRGAANTLAADGKTVVAEEPLSRDFTVIGVIEDLELSDDFYVSNRQVGFIPFTVFERMQQEGSDFVVVRPHDRDEVPEMLRQIRETLHERYHIAVDNENATLAYYDAIDRGRKIDRVFQGIRLFLNATALLILLLGAVGVANVVLMSVTARTFEFGLRRALGCRRRWIFLQVFLEVACVCAVSGAVGFAAGALLVEVARVLPLPEGFARPIADPRAALVPGILLAAVSIAAALWPALRAVRVDPVVALRGGAL